MLTRRNILVGLSAVICAPAIVRASSLMPVKSFVVEVPPWKLFNPSQAVSAHRIVTDRGFNYPYYPAPYAAPSYRQAVSAQDRAALRAAHVPWWAM